MIPRPLKVLRMELEDDTEVAVLVGERDTERDVIDGLADVIATCEGEHCYERALQIRDAINTWTFN